MKGRDRRFAQGRVAAGRNERGRLPARDLDREARTREDANASIGCSDACHFVAEPTGPALEALAEPEQAGLRLGARPAQHLFEAGHRCSDNDEAVARVA